MKIGQNFQLYELSTRGYQDGSNVKNYKTVSKFVNVVPIKMYSFFRTHITHLRISSFIAYGQWPNEFDTVK